MMGFLVAMLAVNMVVILYHNVSSVRLICSKFSKRTSKICKLTKTEEIQKIKP